LKWAVPAAVDLGVQNGFNNVFDFAVDLNGWWGILIVVRNGVRSDRFKHRGMEDWINSA